MFCLPKEFSEKVKRAIVKGEINPDILASFDKSMDRRKFFAKFMDEDNARRVNLLYEEKSLLKNQEKATYDFLSDITGMSKKAKEEAATRVKEMFAERRKRIFQPEKGQPRLSEVLQQKAISKYGRRTNLSPDELADLQSMVDDKQFLNQMTDEIFSRKYKTHISDEELKLVTDLTSDLKKAADKMNPETFEFPSVEDRLEYGAADIALKNFSKAVKLEAEARPLQNMLKAEGLGDFMGRGWENTKISTNFILENARALMSSLDDSFFGRQGWKALTNPKYTRLWAKNFIKSFEDLYRVGIKGEDITDSVMAEVLSRPNALNGRYSMGNKLAIGTGEEAFPTSAPSRIPILGRLFKASEQAYEAAAVRLRADLADLQYKLAEKNGIDLTDKFEVGSINTRVNSLTGRGDIAIPKEWQAGLNKAFFSVKLWKSNLDFLTAHTFDKTSKFAKKQAAEDLLITVGTVGVLAAITNQFLPDAIEPDPRSSNFGKFRVKDTRIDYTGGLGGYITLAARLLSGSSVSSQTNKITTLGESFGSPDGMELLWGFTENKFAPGLAFMSNLLKGEDRDGNELSIGAVMEEPGAVWGILSGFAPITWQSLKDMKNERAASLFLVMIADGLGFSANTYSYKPGDKEWMQLKRQKGEEAYKDAVAELNEKMLSSINEITKIPEFRTYDPEERAAMLDDLIKKEKSAVLNKYGITSITAPSGKTIEEVRKGKIGTWTDSKSMIDDVFLYAKSLGKDPALVFQRMMTGQRLRKLENGVIVTSRLPKSESNAIKKKMGAVGDEILDHIIPLTLGGDNSRKNLQLVSEATWASWTPVETKLGEMIRSGKISKREAQKRMLDFKRGKITRTQALR